MNQNEASYSFNKLEKENLPLLLKMAEEILLEDYSVFLDKNVINNYIDSGESDKVIIENINNCIVMKRENICIGFSIIIGNKIDLLMIGKKYRNRGYGTILLKYIEDNLFKKYDFIELQSFSENNVANNFYENNNWIRDGENIMNGILFHKYYKPKNK